MKTALETRTVDLSKFKNAVGLAVTFSCRFGNTRKAAIANVRLNVDEEETTTTPAIAEERAKNRMQLKKQLLVSEEYEAIKSYFGELRTWIYKRTVPSFFKEGFQLCSLAGIADVEDRLKRALRPSTDASGERKELPDLIEAFCAAYPRQVEEARKVLEPVGQFNAGDYPPVDVIRQSFSITWNWIAFTVPEALPEALKAQETEKLERQLKDAGEQITTALRTGFADLVTHLTERLTEEPGAKKKTFRDTAIGNITEFLDTFSNRNLMNDTELSVLVGRARKLLDGVTADKLRKFQNVRDNTLQGFKEIQATLGGMIVSEKGRVIDLDDDEPKSGAADPKKEGELALA